MNLIDIDATVKINGYVTIPLTISELNSEKTDEIINDYVSNLDFKDLEYIDWKIQEYDEIAIVDISGYVTTTVKVDMDNYKNPKNDINKNIENMDFGPLSDITWVIQTCDV